MHADRPPPAGSIRVGDFVVDPRSGELRGASGRQVLSAQPLHVLLALIERPRELVTRDELRARIWPSDTFVDFEHGLNAVVKRLREALGDSARAAPHRDRAASRLPPPRRGRPGPGPGAEARPWSSARSGRTDCPPLRRGGRSGSHSAPSSRPPIGVSGSTRIAAFTPLRLS
jgi:hypothetical protein